MGHLLLGCRAPVALGLETALELVDRLAASLGAAFGLIAQPALLAQLSALCLPERRGARRCARPRRQRRSGTPAVRLRGAGSSTTEPSASSSENPEAF